MDFGKAVYLVVSSVFVSLGGGLAGISMANHDVLMTSLGFFLSAMGYRFLQLGFREEEEFVFSDFDLDTFLNYLGMLVGLVIFSYGFVLAVESSYDLMLLKMLSSGFVIVSGYFILHRGVNGVII